MVMLKVHLWGKHGLNGLVSGSPISFRSLDYVYLMDFSGHSLMLLIFPIVSLIYRHAVSRLEPNPTRTVHSDIVVLSQCGCGLAMYFRF